MRDKTRYYKGNIFYYIYNWTIILVIFYTLKCNMIFYTLYNLKCRHNIEKIFLSNPNLKIHYFSNYIFMKEYKFKKIITFLIYK